MRFKLIGYLILICIACFTTGCPGPDPVLRRGCRDARATNYDPSAEADCDNCCVIPPKTGGVLFWTQADPFFFFGSLMTVKLSNGQQAIITGFYPLAPANCVNQVGGYMLVEEGTYTYEAFASNGSTKIDEGTIKVVGNSCNRFQITP